eukprot:g2284.t1
MIKNHDAFVRDFAKGIFCHFLSWRAAETSSDGYLQKLQSLHPQPINQCPIEEPRLRCSAADASSHGYLQKLQLASAADQPVSHRRNKTSLLRHNNPTALSNLLMLQSLHPQPINQCPIEEPRLRCSGIITQPPYPIILFQSSPGHFARSPCTRLSYFLASPSTLTCTHNRLQTSVSPALTRDSKVHQNFFGSRILYACALLLLLQALLAVVNQDFVAQPRALCTLTMYAAAALHEPSYNRKSGKDDPFTPREVHRGLKSHCP